MHVVIVFPIARTPGLLPSPSVCEHPHRFAPAIGPPSGARPHHFRCTFIARSNDRPLLRQYLQQSQESWRCSTRAACGGQSSSLHQQQRSGVQGLDPGPHWCCKIQRKVEDPVRSKPPRQFLSRVSSSTPPHRRVPRGCSRHLLRSSRALKLPASSPTLASTAPTALLVCREFTAHRVAVAALGPAARIASR